MIFIYSVMVFVCVMVVTWVFFLAVMMLKIKREAGTIPKVALPFAYVVLGVGLTLDVIFNVLSTFLFLELPHEYLFTARVSRLIKFGDGWRKRIATWFCEGFLNPFDAGHCH